MSLTDHLSQGLDAVSSTLQYKLFELNQTPITLSSILMFLLVVLIFFVGSKLLDRILFHRVLPRFQLDTHTQYTLRRVNHYIIVAIGALFAFQFVGIDLSGLAVIFGLLSVGIGFGLQNITSNFISGLILLFERPIRVGDRVTVSGTEGYVIEINMRATTIRTLTNIAIIVPNSEFISKNVTNWSHGDPRIRLDISVGVSYTSDLDNVLEALAEVAREHEKVLDAPAPDVLLSSFGDSSWDMLLRVWIDSPRKYPVIRSELNCAIVRKFRDRGVEIPYPQRDLHVRTPLPIPIHSGQGA